MRTTRSFMRSTESSLVANGIAVWLVADPTNFKTKHQPTLAIKYEPML